MPLIGLETETKLLLERGSGTVLHGGAITSTASLWTPQVVTLQLGGGLGKTDLWGVAKPWEVMQPKGLLGSHPMLLQCKLCQTSIKKSIYPFSNWNSFDRFIRILGGDSISSICCANPNTGIGERANKSNPDMEALSLVWLYFVLVRFIFAH